MIVEGETDLKYLVTGTPGIGKSMFLLYFLWFLLKDPNLAHKRPRVLIIYGNERVWYYDRNGVHKANLKTVHKFKDHEFGENTYCLVDIQSANFDINMFPMERTKFVLSASPKERVSRNINRRGSDCRYLFMPVWSEEELQSIASLHPKCTTIVSRQEEGGDLVNNAVWVWRYKELGGVPRLVIEQIENTPTEILDKAAKDAPQQLGDLFSLLKTGVGFGKKSQLVHHLMHIHSSSTDNYRTASVKWASDTALRKYCAQHSSTWKSVLQSVTANYTDPSFIGSVVGRFFEPAAMESLKNGGKFQEWDFAPL
jgi:hypothetical protein